MRKYTIHYFFVFVLMTSILFKSKHLMNFIPFWLSFGPAGGVICQLEDAHLCGGCGWPRTTEREKEKAVKKGKTESKIAAVMDLRSELLKSIWYAFTALDVEKSGKVSKSQLKVSCKSINALWLNFRMLKNGVPYGSQISRSLKMYSLIWKREKGSMKYLKLFFPSYVLLKICHSLALSTCDVFPVWANHHMPHGL